MDFRILGAVDVLAGDRPVRLAGPRQRALLAYLLLHRDEISSVDRLLAELWYDPPSGGAAALHTQVSRLRRSIGGRIETVGNGYSIRLEPGELDLDRFRSLLAEAGGTTDPTERSRLLRAADELWRGQPLEALEAPFVAAEVRALEELRLAAVEARIDAELERGGNGELISELSSLVARHPLRERLRARLILALYRNDRQAEALEAYHEARRMLDEELGLEPSPALRELERAILRHDPALATPAPVAAPAATGSSPPARPPTAVASNTVLLTRVAVLAVILLGAGTVAALLAFRRDGENATTRPPVTSTAARVAVAPTRTTADRPRHRALRTRARAKPPVARVRVVTVSIAAPAATTSTVQVKPATTTHTTTTRRRPATTVARKPAELPPAQTTVADRFSGPLIDGVAWYQIRHGSGWDLSQSGGHLEFSFPPGTTDGSGGYVGTLCKFPDDFDARVDFTLTDWPPGNSSAVTLRALFGAESDGFQIARESSPQLGERYSTSAGIAVATSDPFGTLRLVRHKGVITASFLDNSRWVSLASTTDARWATLSIGAAGPAAGAEQVTADFDNFKATASPASCPR
jgi:DNA-binding SARP family transcriptional activator